MNNTKHILSSVMTYHQVCNNSNSTGATNGAGTLEFIPFVVGSYNSIFSFICNVLQIIACPFVLCFSVVYPPSTYHYNFCFFKLLFDLKTISKRICTLIIAES